MWRLLEKTKIAENLLKENGKYVIVLLGATGAGKSTTIHFLAGSKMIETKVEMTDNDKKVKENSEKLALAHIDYIIEDQD